MKLNNKIIFITGAAKGIGFELAKQLAKLGNTVIIGARNQQLLDQIAANFVNIETIYFDALEDNNIIEVRNELQKRFGKIDMLINNAAVCNSYNFYQSILDFDKIDTEIATNISSPIKLTKSFLPLLDKKTETAIINITSGVAYLPMPNLPIYSATKAALQSFTISLRQSLEPTNINVFEVLPPLVATQMTENLIGNGKNMNKISPKDCAKQIIEGITKRNKTILIGSSKSLYWGSKFFPSVVQKQLNKM
jgi:uncharacterized oxidoreductase